MLTKLKGKARRQQRRHLRIRKRVIGTAERPRLMVRKTLKHVYVMAIDDSTAGGSTTLAAVTTARKGEMNGKGHRNIASGSAVGKEIAKLLLDKGINKAVFDRGGFPYHGVVKAVADGAREAGLGI